jgi:hypothetical protein
MSTSLMLQGRQVTLTRGAQISVLTMGPDKNELYSAFGHNAIRVYDPILGINKAYNYGTFNYDDPNFYINFTKGYLNYYLSTGDYSRLLRFYEYYDRWVHEQILDLTPEEAQRVYVFLENNALPENATYFYDYFYDNCATRIRDVFVAVFADSVRFNTSFEIPGMTVRELTDLYLEDKFPWGDLGIDLCLGLPMDKQLTNYQYMFLPDYIEAGFEHATLLDSLGNEKALVREEKAIYTSKSVPAATFYTPAKVFGFVLIIGLLVTWWQWRNSRRGRWLDFSLFLASGLLGILLMMLWFFTDHNAAANNLNILWAFPLNAFAAFYIFRPSKTRTTYFNLLGIGMFILLLVWNFLPQDLHYSLMPLTTLLMVRAFYIANSFAYNHQRI